MKLKIIILTGLMLLVDTIFTQIEIDNQSLNNHNDLEFEWEIISEFMKDQHVVTLFVEKDNEVMGDKLLKYSTKNYKFGVYHYNNITLITQFWASFQKYTIYSNRIYGAILVIRTVSMMNEVINSCANNRLVLVMFDVTIEKIKNIMWNTWNRRKIYELITLSIHNNGANIIVQLNPFVPKFYEYPINSNDSSKAIVELINYRYRLFMTNMAGYEMKILIFNSSGNVIDYSAVDGAMIKLFKKFMNFTPILIEDHLLEPNAILELVPIKMIENGQAEISINSKFILDVSYNNTVFLYPTDKVPMCFIVPINYEEVPLKVLTYDCFDLKSRVVITLNLIILSAIWLLGRKLIKKNVETATNAIPFKVIALLHSVTVTSPKSIFNQIVFITIAIFSLLLTSVYQGTVVTQLNNPLKPHQLNTLNELLNSNLNLTILSYIKYSVKKIQQGINKDNMIMMEEIDKKIVLHFDLIDDGLDMVAYNKTSAFMMPTILFYSYSVKYFNKTTGLDLLHLIKESPISILVSYAVARNSPYIRVFNYVVKLAVESGILDHEIMMATDQQRLDYIRRIKNGYVPKMDDQFRPIQLADIIYLREFVTINWTLSSVVFLLEHAVHFLMKFMIQRNYWPRRRTDFLNN